MKKLFALLMCVVLLAAVMGGCGTAASSTGGTTSTATGGTSAAGSSQPAAPVVGESINAGSAAKNNAPPADAKIKEAIYVGTTHDPEVVDPHMNTDNERVQRLVYSALVIRNADGEIEGDLAKSWEQNEDGTVWTFKLRDDVTWHSGKQFTAEDVKATFDRVTDKANPLVHTPKMSFIAETNIIDDYTVEIVTDGVFAPFLGTLTGYYGMILNKDYIEQYGMDLGKQVESVDGTGPYKLTGRTWGEEVVLTANDAYYGGAPYTKEIHFVVIAEATARTIALETGEVDLITNPNASDIPLMRDNEEVFIDYTQAGGQYFFIYNCSDQSVMKDPLLRQAFNYAVDRQGIIDALLSDIGAIAPHSVLSNCFGLVDLGYIEQDYDKAKALMAEAGYPDGFDVELFACEVYMKNTAQAEMIKEQCAQVGINVNITVGDSATFGSLFSGLRPEELSYDMFCMGMASESGDLDEIRGLYTTSVDGTNAANYGFYSNAEFDQVAAQQAATADEAERLELLKRCQEILYLEDPVGCLIYNNMNIHCMSAAARNFSVNHRGIVYYQYMWVLDE